MGIVGTGFSPSGGRQKCRPYQAFTFTELALHKQFLNRQQKSDRRGFSSALSHPMKAERGVRRWRLSAAPGHLR